MQAFRFELCRFRFFSLPVLGIRFPRSVTCKTIGICLGPIILIREDYWDDQSTWLHEIEHVKQTVRNGVFIHFLLYYFSRQYRCRCEVQAYASELEIIDNAQVRQDNLRSFAGILSRNYRLDLSQYQLVLQLEEALKNKRQANY